MKDELVKGGCGHSDAECEFSGMISGIGFLLILASAAIGLIFG